MAGEISATSMRSKGVRGDRAERRAGAEPDDERALVALGEKTGNVREARCASISGPLLPWNLPLV